MSIIKQSAVGSFGESITKDSGVVTLKFKFAHDELSNTMGFLTGCNNNINLSMKCPNKEKPLQLGMFSLSALNFKGTGECTIAFNSVIEAVNADNVTKLPLILEKGEKCRLYLDIDIEDEDEPEDDEWAEDDLEEDTETWGDDDENNKEDWD